MVDLSFEQQMAIVVVPILIGAISSKWITTSWQVRKETNQIKQNIIRELNESIGAHFTLLGIFVSRVFDSYVDYSRSRIIREAEIETPLNFGKHDSELPINKFQSENTEFVKKYWDLSYSGSQFASSLVLYFENNTLLIDMTKINYKIGTIFLMIQQWLRTKTEIEFGNYDKKIEEKLEELQKAIEKLSQDIIASKVKMK